MLAAGAAIRRPDRCRGDQKGSGEHRRRPEETPQRQGPRCHSPHLEHAGTAAHSAIRDKRAGKEDSRERDPPAGLGRSRSSRVEGSGGADQNFLRMPKVNTRPSTLPLLRNRCRRGRRADRHRTDCRYRASARRAPARPSPAACNRSGGRAAVKAPIVSVAWTLVRQEDTGSGTCHCSSSIATPVNGPVTAPSWPRTRKLGWPNGTDRSATRPRSPSGRRRDIVARDRGAPIFGPDPMVHR